jgi:hypothetical protein
MNHYLISAFVKKLKMKTFNDLQFETMTSPLMSGKKARIHFENGFGASVVSHDMSYGGKDGLYELAVLFDDELHYDNPVAHGDVRGYLSEEEVTELLMEIQKL